MMEPKNTAELLAALDDMGTSGGVPITALIDLSNEHKPGGSAFDDDAGALEVFAEDGPEAKTRIKQHLQTLKIGWEAARPTPLMATGLLTWLVERIASLLDQPPSYRWSGPDELVDEDEPTHRDGLEAVDEMDLTSALRKLHRGAVCTGQAYLRVYPTEEGGLQPRVFGAAGVHRIPHAALADQLQYDHVTALPLSGEAFEVHWQSNGVRRMVWCDKEGRLMASSPFMGEDHVTPYDVLPVIRLTSEATVGAPYIAPRASRVTYVLQLSGLLNELLGMSYMQAHSMFFQLQPDTPGAGTESEEQGVPKIGPGQGFKLPPGHDVKFETPKPLIDQVLGVLRALVRTFLMSEHIPQQEADGDTVLTGQALLVAERGQKAKSEAMRPLVVRAARDAWRIARAVHEKHSGEAMPELDLLVQMAPAQPPVTETELLDNLSKAMALELASKVQGMQRYAGVDREDAIDRLGQVGEDLKTYGKGTADDLAGKTGGGFTETLNAGEGETFDSVADVNRGRTAGEARQQRREGEAAA